MPCFSCASSVVLAAAAAAAATPLQLLPVPLLRCCRRPAPPPAASTTWGHCWPARLTYAFICLRRLPQISIIDGRKYDTEGDGEDVLERCELLCNKQGQPLLAHGRSGRCVRALAGGALMRGLV